MYSESGSGGNSGDLAVERRDCKVENESWEITLGDNRFVVE